MRAERFDPSDDSIHSLAGAYMAGILTAEEFDIYQDHLATCDSCVIEIGEMEAATDALFCEEHAPVSGSLIGKIMAGIDGVQITTEPEISAPALVGESSRSSARIGRLFALAAAVLLVVGGGFAYLQTRTVTPSEIAASEDATTILLSDITDSGLAAVELVASASEGRVALVDQSMALLSSDQSYALWRIPAEENAAPEFVGLISVANGTANQTFVASLEGAGAFAVSIEAAGASPTVPSDQVIMAGGI